MKRFPQGLEENNLFNYFIFGNTSDCLEKAKIQSFAQRDSYYYLVLNVRMILFCPISPNSCVMQALPGHRHASFPRSYHGNRNLSIAISRKYRPSANNSQFPNFQCFQFKNDCNLIVVSFSCNNGEDSSLSQIHFVIYF